MAGACFATHYAKLANAHEGSTDVAIRHMACEVTASPSGCEQVWSLTVPKVAVAPTGCPMWELTSGSAGLPGDLSVQAGRWVLPAELWCGVRARCRCAACRA